jgi:D-amino-acid dehydrogenase
VKQGKVAGVETSTGAIMEADIAVLAAGSWSGELARSVGLTIPLQPAKGYSCTIDSYAGSPRIPLLMPESRVIITPLDGRLRFGGTLELAGFDSTVDKRRYRAVVDGARAVLRDPPPMIQEESWTGFRPLTPDGLPIIDRVAGVEGLLLATGHAMLGFTQSPITGKLVAELANQEKPSIPLAPFGLNRFDRLISSGSHGGIATSRR